MHSLENKIPPPLVLVIFAILAWGLARIAMGLELGDFDFEMPMRNPVTLAITCIGLGFGLGGSFSFKKAATTINPLRPEKASALVTSGVFQITRNPMYLGLSLLLLGWSIYLGSMLALLCVPAFMFYLYRFQITPEERALEQLFGTDFVAYKNKVRRWL